MSSINCTEVIEKPKKLGYGTHEKLGQPLTLNTFFPAFIWLKVRHFIWRPSGTHSPLKTPAVPMNRNGEGVHPCGSNNAKNSISWWIYGEREYWISLVLCTGKSIKTIAQWRDLRCRRQSEFVRSLGPAPYLSGTVRHIFPLSFLRFCFCRLRCAFGEELNNVFPADNPY